MNKKLISIITALCLGVSLLVGTTLIVAGQTSGYDVYKNSMKKIYKLNNFTADADFSISMGDIEFYSDDMLIKFDRENKALSANIDMKHGPKQLKEEAYIQDGRMIDRFGSNEVYSVYEDVPEGIFDNLEKGDSIIEGFEGIVDAYVGSRTNSFTMETDGDGIKTITASLDENQITPLDKSIVALAVKLVELKALNDGKVEGTAPKFLSEVTVKRVDIKAVVDDNDNLRNQTASMAISGNDSSGNVHDLVVAFKLSLKDVNSTKVDKVDLAGKKTRIVKNRH